MDLFLKPIDPNRVTNPEKKKLLARYIETRVLTGHSIVELMGKPLSNYDYEKIKKYLEEHDEFRPDEAEQLFKPKTHEVDNNPYSGESGNWGRNTTPGEVPEAGI